GVIALITRVDTSHEELGQAAGMSPIVQIIETRFLAGRADLRGASWILQHFNHPVREITLITGLGQIRVHAIDKEVREVPYFGGNDGPAGSEIFAQFIR